MEDLNKSQEEGLEPLEGEDPENEGQDEGQGQDEGKDKGEEGSDDAGKEGGEKEPGLEEQLAARDAEIQELRQLLRENKRVMDELSSRVEGSEKILDKAGILSEEDKKAQKEQDALVKQREKELDTVLEMMRLNPKYEDVDSVVSQSNFDDMIEAMAKDYAERNGVSIREASADVEAWVWSLTNPYRYMYDLIKKHHPSFQKAEGGKKKKAADAPASLQNLDGGAGGGDVGWTASKIDNLPEEELSKVPREIYSKYLAGELK